MKIIDLFEDTLSAWYNKPIVVYNEPYLVYHTTNEESANDISKQGFKTGKELNKNEKRGAVYFADKDEHNLYARNDREGEPYFGQKSSHIQIDIKGLRLLNLSYRKNDEFVFQPLTVFATRGDLEKIPMFVQRKIDGTIQYLKDGTIYQVTLPKETVNRLISS